MHVPNYIDNLDEISVADKIWNSNFHFSPWPQGSKSSKPKENNNNHILVTMTRLHIGNLWSNKWIIILGANEPPGQPLTHLVSELVCLTQLCWVRIIDEPTTNRSTKECSTGFAIPFIHSLNPSINHLYLSWLLAPRAATIIQGKKGREHPREPPPMRLIVWGLCLRWWVCLWFYVHGVNEEGHCHDAIFKIMNSSLELAAVYSNPYWQCIVSLFALTMWLNIRYTLF